MARPNCSWQLNIRICHLIWILSGVNMVFISSIVFFFNSQFFVCYCVINSKNSRPTSYFYKTIFNLNLHCCFSFFVFHRFNNQIYCFHFLFMFYDICYLLLFFILFVFSFEFVVFLVLFRLFYWKLIFLQKEQ